MRAGRSVVRKVTVLTVVVVMLAGFVAGFINVLAGGGSFLTLPALIAAGLTALGANASSTVALFPAQAVTALMARKDFVIPQDMDEVSVKVLAIISVVGGFFGGVLLLVTPPGLFIKIVPWLILFATGVFARGSALARSASGMRLDRRGIYVVQSIVSIYGGYFGGGIGILMLAALTVFGFRDMRVMNSVKIVLAMLMNIAAVITFVLAGLVQWPQTIWLGVPALAGSIVGLVAARHVPSTYVRAFVIVVGLGLSVAFFFRIGLT